MDREVRMGQLPREWYAAAKSITFCVTEDCNLACKYCYMTGKNSKNRMPVEVAKAAVDYILSDRTYFKEEAVVWEFIGGEPFLEIDLIDRICDYIKHQMFLRKHPWFDAYRFNFSTNGLTYHTSKVQKYIWKNQSHVSIGISIDGNRTKHDLQRVRKDGSGSFDAVMKNVPLWLSQMPNSATKATFSHGDLPHLKDSVIALWDMGIKTVAANVVFEDVWAEGDDDVFEDQLRQLADHIIDHELFYDHSVRFFDPHVGNPLTEDDLDSNFCGAGKMLAIDHRGNFYPCIRFYDISLSNRPGLKIGDIHSGINHDRLRPFHALTLRTQSTDECIQCEVGKGCAWCNGCNYDCADTDTIFQRATFICKMHKANARANDYFWKRVSEVTGQVSEKDKVRAGNHWGATAAPRFMYIMTSDAITPHCNYRNTDGRSGEMDGQVFIESLEFCEANGFIPVLLGSLGTGGKTAGSLSILGAGESQAPEASIAVFDNDVPAGASGLGNAILLVMRHRLRDLSKLVDRLIQSHARINIILEDIENWDDEHLAVYEEQLGVIVETTRQCFAMGRSVEINVLTDLWHLTGICDCGAGEENFTIAPNGKIYLCPAFYYNDSDDHVGTLQTGIRLKNPGLLKSANSPYCSRCDVYSCRRCKFLNKRLTGEIGIPSRIQCLVSHVERTMSMKLERMLMDEGVIHPINVIRPVSHVDPLELVVLSTRTRG
jgi:uncharacterized protein